MKRLYLETNYIVGQAFQQDPTAAQLLNVAQNVGAEVCIPSICLHEAVTAVQRGGRYQRTFGQMLTQRINQIRTDHSPTAQSLLATLNQALIDNGRLINEREVRLTTVIGALTQVRLANISQTASHRAVSNPIIKGAADNLILYAICNDAQRSPATDMVLLTGNTRDFNVPAVTAFLGQVGINLLVSSQATIKWLNQP